MTAPKSPRGVSSPSVAVSTREARRDRFRFPKRSRGNCATSKPPAASAMSDDGLLVNDVTKTYPTRAESLEVLRGVTFSLRPGDNLAIVGASGSGKSTLLSILGALETPTSGTVTLRGENPFAFHS